MSTLAAISLGSNLGDRRANLDAAIGALAVAPEIAVVAVSSYHETDPVGGPPGQGAFLNAAATIETALPPVALLARLRDIEAAGGRVRSTRWEARTIDLDLLIQGDLIHDDPSLTLPHPRLAFRRFVLAPLAEIAPSLVEPITGRSIGDLLQNLDRRPSYLALVGDPAITHRLFTRLIAALPALGIVFDAPPDPDEPFAGRGSGVSDDIAWHRFLEQSERKLLAEHWRREPRRDRWIVSDSWFDLVYRDGLPRARDRRREAFLQARSLVIPPTFLVAVGPAGRFALSVRATHPRLAPPRCDIPVLSLDSDDLDLMVVEVLAACSASRSP